jgi:NADPH:quinone reductase-like Zn-dependent oxidoreductase
VKAWVHEKYGPPEVLQLKEVDKPVPKDNEVLVKIHAASLNAADLEYLRGTSIVRISGLRKPKYKILGSDIAGRVESVGRKVKEFQPGDDIFVDSSVCGFGAFAEYVCIPEDALALKPDNITYEDAATLPQAAILALQGLRDKKQIQSGQKVLINGAGGGVGTFAVQLAKYFEAEVTGVDNASKLDMVLSLGADHVIDCKKEDFTRSGLRYDLILDVVVHRSIFDYKRALNPKGSLVMVGGSVARMFSIAFLGLLIPLLGSKRMSIVMWKPNQKENSIFLTDLLEAGKVVPIIDRRYPLSKVPEALQYLEEGHAQGKVVINMEHTNTT